MTANNNSQSNIQPDPSFSVSGLSHCGFEISDLENSDPRFLCVFCQRIICDAVQLSECGHRCCRAAVEDPNAALIDGNIICPVDDCHVKTNKNQIMPDKGFQKELNSLTVTCMYQTDKSTPCSWTGKLKDYQGHLDENHFDYTCSECNENFTSSAALNFHKTQTCRSIFQSCQLAPFCTEQMIRKSEFLTHMLSEKHQETINKIFIGEHHLPTSSQQQQEIESNAMNTELQEQFVEKLNDLSGRIQTLSMETIKINDNYTHLNERMTSVTQELNDLYGAMNERSVIKQCVPLNQEKLQKDIEEVRQMCHNNEFISMDGTLTWRVDHVSEKMADAQSERQTSLYSPVFYSSLTGYKMRVRLFLFGDGNARRTHMSLFISILKGEYDAILKWPFHFKVTFCLLDQTGNNRHIIDSFYPDVKSNSFQRPKDAANIASGIPKFFPLPMLLQDDNAYVRDDALYIKIIVGLVETHKTIIPYMLTLNPALPNYVQESIMEKEAAKRQQQTGANLVTEITSMNT